MCEHKWTEAVASCMKCGQLKTIEQNMITLMNDTEELLQLRIKRFSGFVDVHLVYKDKVIHTVRILNKSEDTNSNESAQERQPLLHRV